ncbi:hypothetical protein ACLB6G_20300 [Zhengella sp. ZM62]|uniref:hypothetical protein n=1 Tax=Zhengella sedimenti TaxID=3390035 RepID=UPI0039761D30
MATIFTKLAAAIFADVSAIVPTDLELWMTTAETKFDEIENGASTNIVDSTAALKEVDTGDVSVVVARISGAAVPYVWVSTVPIATHQSDTNELYYVAPNAAADGAWVALFDKSVPLSIAGGGPEVTNNNAALAAAAKTAKFHGGNQVQLLDDAPVTTEVLLGDVADATFVGKEEHDITGLYYNRPNRKWVTPQNRGNPYAFLGGDVIPSEHLLRLNRAAAWNGEIKVAIFGDSLGTYRPGDGFGRMDLKVEAYRSALSKAFPGVTVTLNNFSIGGQTFDDWDKTGTDLAAAGVTLSDYPWFTTAGNTWISYVEAFAPDLVIVAFGQNNAGTNLLVTELKDIADEIESWTTVPSIVWETTLSQSAQYSGSSTEDRINRLDGVAGLTRSYARYRNHGVIDMHRMGCLAVSGFDPRLSGEFGPGVSPTPAATTNSTEAAMNWRVVIEYDASSWTNGSADYIRVRTGSGTGADYVQVKKLAGGTWQVLWNGGYSGGIVSDFENTSYTAATSSTSKIVFEVNDDMVTVYDDDTSTGAGKEAIWSGPVVRNGGLTVPYVTVSSLTNIPLDSVTFYHGRPRVAIPTINDSLMWTPPSNTWKGMTTINHPSAVASPYIYRLALEQINWRTALADTRTIVGSGTPESNVAAPVGTMYLRTDGGAGTTLYVKESGTGNTGWAAM